MSTVASQSILDLPLEIKCKFGTVYIGTSKLRTLWDQYKIKVFVLYLDVVLIRRLYLLSTSIVHVVI